MNEIIVINNNIKKGYIFIYLIFSIVISNLFFSNFKMEKNDYLINSNHKITIYFIFFAICALITLIIGVLIIFTYKSNKPIHKKFLILALVIGMLHLIITPFLRGADEQAHFCRIYEISKGNLITPVDENGVACNELPSSIKKLHNEQDGKFLYTNLYNSLSLKLNKDEVENFKNYYISISLYSPIQYIPQAFGVLIARKLNLTVYFIGMIGRITGFIFWLFICYNAIKKIPKNKVFFMLLMLSPIFIGYATTLSGDMMLNSMVVLLVSNIYYLRCTKEKISKIDVLKLAIICVIISLCKVVYIPIVLSILFIPIECFKNKKMYYIICCLIIITSIILATGWFLYSNNTYLDKFYTNSNLQKQFIIHHPIKYIIIMLRTLLNYFIIFLTYSSQVSIYPIISISIWIILFFALFCFMVSICF